MVGVSCQGCFERNSRLDEPTELPKRNAMIRESAGVIPPEIDATAELHFRLFKTSLAQKQASIVEWESPLIRSENDRTSQRSLRGGTVSFVGETRSQIVHVVGKKSLASNPNLGAGQDRAMTLDIVGCDDLAQCKGLIEASRGRLRCQYHVVTKHNRVENGFRLVREREDGPHKGGTRAAVLSQHMAHRALKCRPPIGDRPKVALIENLSKNTSFECLSRVDTTNGRCTQRNRGCDVSGNYRAAC